MNTTISEPASCEGHPVIHFLLVKKNIAAEIHKHLCEVYGPNFMNESMVTHWCNLFKEGQTSMMNSAVADQVTDDLVEKVNMKICENHFMISGLATEFLDISHSVIYDALTKKLGYKKLCSRWVPETKMLKMHFSSLGILASSVE